MSPLLGEAIAVALRAAALTDGAVDPTVGEALVLAGYDRDFAEVLRAPRRALRARRVPGWQAVALDRAAGRARIPRGTLLDLGATAKALAADRAAEAARRAAGGGVLVNLGGDIAVAGPPPGGGWAVRIADDGGPEADAAGRTVTIRSAGLATSSTSVRRWGEARHHIIDPATGLSAASPWRTVSVAAASCVDANIASTAAIVRGEDAAGWLAERALPARLVGERRRCRGGRRLAGGGDGGVIAVAGHGPSSLWYATRGAGATTLVLLTASVVLGIGEVRLWRPADVPRFTIAALHRTLSLLALAFLAVHVVTVLLDPFPRIGLLTAAVPFASSYRPLWLGLGTLASDLLVALVVTSLVRRRLGYGAWRWVHWLAYACWPVAVLHGLGTGSDARATWMLALTACLRRRRGRRPGGPARRARASPPARAWAAPRPSRSARSRLAVFLAQGPLASGWAQAGRDARRRARCVLAAAHRGPQARTAPPDPLGRSFSGAARRAGAQRRRRRRHRRGRPRDAPQRRSRAACCGSGSAASSLPDGGLRMDHSAVTLGPQRRPGSLPGAHPVPAGDDAAGARGLVRGRRAERLTVDLSLGGDCGRAARCGARRSRGDRG